MAQDQNQFCVKVFHCIFDAGKIIVSGDVSGNPNDKQIAQALIKYQFRWNPRVRTAQDHREWMLAAF